MESQTTTKAKPTKIAILAECGCHRGPRGSRPIWAAWERGVEGAVREVNARCPACGHRAVRSRATKMGTVCVLKADHDEAWAQVFVSPTAGRGSIQRDVAGLAYLLINAMLDRRTDEMWRYRRSA